MREFSKQDERTVVEYLLQESNYSAIEWLLSYKKNLLEEKDIQLIIECWSRGVHFTTSSFCNLSELITNDLLNILIAASYKQERIKHHIVHAFLEGYFKLLSTDSKKELIDLYPGIISGYETLPFIRSRKIIKEDLICDFLNAEVVDHICDSLIVKGIIE